jgi:hypothetical protein
MSKLTFSILLSGAFLASILFSQNNSGAAYKANDLTIHLNDTMLICAYITDYYPDINFKDDADFAGVAWSDVSGKNYIGRTIFKMDLSFIPKNATVTNAQLILNYNTSPVHYSGPGHHKDGGSNACFIQRITQKWNADSVTWNNQPETTTENQIILNESNSDYQDYTIDMTAAINDMMKNPSNNFGFMLRLQTESPIRALGFASSDYFNIDKRPVLQISYTTP